MTGRADYLEIGDWNCVCYQCGRKRKASKMRKHWQGYWVCPEHWEPRQTQDFVRNIPDVMTPPWAQPMPADHFLPTDYTQAIADTLTITGGQPAADYLATPADYLVTPATYFSAAAVPELNLVMTYHTTAADTLSFSETGVLTLPLYIDPTYFVTPTDYIQNNITVF